MYHTQLEQKLARNDELLEAIEERLRKLEKKPKEPSSMNDFMFHRYMCVCWQNTSPEDREEMTAIIKRTMDKQTAKRLLNRLEEVL